ncbi:type III pantothenate kinase, partial [Candidatus Pelagibacter sp.]|nr:type III pantothenate kinase [Candidatus Pelagibacter sp.]
NMYLIGDIGNTDIKLCLFNDNKKKIKKIILKTEKLSFSYMRFKLKGVKFKNIKKILFCSVVPKSYKLVKKFFNLYTNIKCKEIKDLKISKLIKIKVNKKQIGSDRIANAISAANNKNNFIIVDFGTATTFDVVLKNSYIGGVIAPGLELSLSNLINKASLIPKIKFNKVKHVLGKNTVDSVKSGFYWGYTGLINNILSLITKEFKYKFKIILTGGLAHLFKNNLKYNSYIDKELTINGLIKII